MGHCRVRCPFLCSNGTYVKGWWSDVTGNEEGMGVKADVSYHTFALLRCIDTGQT